MHLLASRCSHATTRKQLNGFSWNLILKNFTKFVETLQFSLKSDNNNGRFAWRPTSLSARGSDLVTAWGNPQPEMCSRKHVGNPHNDVITRQASGISPIQLRCHWSIWKGQLSHADGITRTPPPPNARYLYKSTQRWQHSERTRTVALRAHFLT
jgi:hypothetical protein